MPLIFRAFFLLFLFFGLSFADSIDDDIASSNSLDELVSKMNGAPYENRYRYMNAIKKQLMEEKIQDRKSKLDAALKSHQENAKSQKNQGNFGNNFGGANTGGKGGNGDGNGNGGGGKR
jgi:hypothetical protein